MNTDCCLRRLLDNESGLAHGDDSTDVGGAAVRGKEFPHMPSLAVAANEALGQ